MMKLVFIVMTLVAFCRATQWSSCNATSTMKIQNVSVLPDPPKSGANVTLIGYGTLSSQVSQGTLVFSVSYWISGIGWRLIPGFPMSFNVCNFVTCPLNTGQVSLKRTIYVPLITPPGRYQGNLSMSDQSGNSVSCILWSTNIVS